ncbi:Hypothetical protein D9617_14g076130 [Elsinoe fawcettii]|nr:Hypothetical protein D9617_14g076130 [Elsinoe fawcettii]
MLLEPGAELLPMVHVSLDEFAPGGSQTFNFTGLPIEIRFMIFDFVFLNAYSGINTIVAEGVHRILSRPHPQAIVAAPVANRVVPGILLVSHHTYQEAIRSLRSRTLTFEHGLMHFRLRDLLRWTTFRNIRHIVITDIGHDILASGLTSSFSGHRRLFQSLAVFLNAPGHCLEYLEIDFSHAGLKHHLNNCWEARTPCDMRRWMESVYTALGHIRGVRQVKITGYIHDDMKIHLTKLIQSPPSALARLPQGTRYRIFSYVVRRFETVSTAMNIASRTGCLPKLSTPNLLLVERSITGIYLSALRREPLVLELFHAPLPGRDRLSSFISDWTLRSMTSIHIIIYHRSWLPILAEIATTLSSGHSLINFELAFYDNYELPCGIHSTSLRFLYPDWDLADLLRPLETLTDVGEVRFSGDLGLVKHSRILRWLYVSMTGRRMDPPPPPPPALLPPPQ